MKKRNNAGPRKFKAPKRKQATSQQQRYLSAKTKVFRVSPGKKGSLRNPNILFIKDIAAPKNPNSSGKGQLILFQAKHRLKKSMGSKKKGTQKHSAKKVWAQKKVSSEKKGTHTFSGQQRAKKV